MSRKTEENYVNSIYALVGIVYHYKLLQSLRYANLIDNIILSDCR